MRLALVILAILAERGPNTGYGIGRLLRSELRHFSNAKLQQVYFELAVLNRANNSAQSLTLISKEMDLAAMSTRITVRSIT